MKVALAQINPIVGDLEHNLVKILENIERAKKAGAGLVVFSEMALIGYPAEDLLLRSDFIEKVDRQIAPIAAASKGIAAIVGTVRPNRGKGKPLFNTAALFENGHLVGFQDKQLLAEYDLFFERRYFEPADKRQLWRLGNHSLAITICEDIWQHSSSQDPNVTYGQDPLDFFKESPCEAIINISASPYAQGRIAIRQRVCQNAAKDLQIPLVLVNQVGGNDSLIFDGHSALFDKSGELVIEAKGFEEDLVVVDLFSPKKMLCPKKEPDEELLRALTLGTIDYFGKQGFKKACLGLSGGIDSALVAYIASLALGKENVVALTLPSRFSSQKTLEDAHSYADLLGISIIEVPIEQVHKSALDLLTPYFGHRQADFTEENLQARIRCLLLMAFCNKFGYLLLNTSNKSELAMGYSTLYGDMGGSLALIGDLTKSEVYRLARWINRNEMIIPTSIVNRPPTAELKEDQFDTDTLPPYEIVDLVVRGYMEENQSIDQIAQENNVPKSVVQELVLRLQGNEYKRHQVPPSLRVTKKCFTAGRRVPIVAKY